MKLSIWQQFSSNHSGSFSVVGKFKSGQEAQTAAQKLLADIEKIGAWHEEHPGEYDFQGPPHPPEQEIIDRYQLNWDEEFGFGEDALASIDIIIFENLLLLEIAETRSNMQHEVLKQWVEKLGATNAGMLSELEGEQMNYLQIHLSFDAPDETTAADIEEKTSTSLKAAINHDPSEMVEWLQFDELDNLEKGIVTRNGLHLTLTVMLNHPVEDIQMLINKLREQGCTNFDYTFEDIERDFDY
jgi:hypothetical protein